MRSTRLALILLVGVLAFVPAAQAVAATESGDAIAGRSLVESVLAWASALRSPASGAGTDRAGTAVVTAQSTQLPVYRFRNLEYGTHFYTASEAEYTDVYNNKKAELTYEGIGYKVAPKDTAGTVPVHRFLSKKYAYVHFYTANNAEYQNALNNLKADWQYEGVGYAVWEKSAGTLIPVNRFMNLNYGVHFYTAAQSEYNTAIGMPTTYKLEGIGFYVEPNTPDGLDTTVPIVTVLTPVNNSVVTTDSPVLAYTVVDAQDPSVVVTIAVDGAPWSGSSGQRLGPLSLGSHRVRVGAIDRGGNTASATTSFTVVAASSVLTRYEETDSRLRFKGAWANAQGAGFSGGSERTLDETGSAIVGFEGTEIRLFASTGPEAGIASVSLDGGTPIQVSLYRPEPGTAVSAVEATGLADIPHTLKVEWTGSKDASSTGTGISFDAVEASGTLVQAPDPLQVVPELDTDSSVTETVTAEAGGTLELTSDDGTYFKLEVPPGALMDTQSVTMTRVAALGGLPLTQGLVGGVELSPSGLQLEVEATLTVTPSGAAPPDSTQVVGYGCREDGSEFYLCLQDAQAGSYAVRLHSFSGHGVVAGTPTQVTNLVANNVPTEGAGEQELVPLDQEGRRAWLMQQFPDVYRALTAAEGNRSQLDLAWNAAEQWISNAEHAGVESQDVDLMRSHLHRVIISCFYRAKVRAIEGRIEEMARMYRWHWRAKYNKGDCGVTSAEIGQMHQSLKDVSVWRVKFKSSAYVEDPTPYGSSGGFDWMQFADDSGQGCEPFPHDIVVEEMNQLAGSGSDDASVDLWTSTPIEFKIPATIPSGVTDSPDGDITNVRFTWTTSDPLKQRIPLHIVIDPQVSTFHKDSGLYVPARYIASRDSVSASLDFELFFPYVHHAGVLYPGVYKWLVDYPKENPPSLNVTKGYLFGIRVDWGAESANPYSKMTYPDTGAWVYSFSRWEPNSNPRTELSFDWTGQYTPKSDLTHASATSASVRFGQGE